MRFMVERRTIRRHGSKPGPLQIELNLPGLHNVRNALAAIGIATELGVQDEAIVKALAEFSGVGRRFQRYGDISLAKGGRFTLIDDYGHHPVEMAATLAAARGAYPGRRLVLAFQPHRYTRTRDCFGDFVEVLRGFDALVLTDVYPAGEARIKGADGESLFKATCNGNADSSYVAKVADMPAAITAMLRDGDVVITMGAGSISTLAAALSGAQHA
jgi:UDP-N-acetylmuramate--alanine ligase